MDIHSIFCTLTEAAAHLGVERHTISRWIGSGKLDAQKIGRIVLIERASVEKLKSTMRGRTRKTGARKRYHFEASRETEIK